MIRLILISLLLACSTPPTCVCIWETEGGTTIWSCGTGDECAWPVEETLR